MESSNETEQRKCFKNLSKSKKEKKVEFDCRENVNNLRQVTRNSELFKWIPTLKLSISDKHFIISGEPMSEKIMNAIISKFNDLIIPYLQEGHKNRLQPIKATLNHIVRCYKEVEGSFVQILILYEFHRVVATNFNLCVTYNTEKTTTDTVRSSRPEVFC